MNDLEIFEFKKKAVVDSRRVAEAIGRPHKQLLRTIKTMEKHLKGAATDNKNVVSGGINHNKNVVVKREGNRHTFAPVNFFIPATYIDEKGEERGCYYLTKLGCDLVANKTTGEKGTRFTAAYVTQFREMEAELARREVQREIKAPVRRSLTDAIRDSGENTRMMGYAYNTYTNLIYKSVTGYTARQLMDKRGAAKNAHAVDFLTSGELAEVTKREAQVCTLLDLGMTYEQIRALLPRKEHRQ